MNHAKKSYNICINHSEVASPKQYSSVQWIIGFDKDNLYCDKYISELLTTLVPCVPGYASFSFESVSKKVYVFQLARVWNDIYFIGNKVSW